MDMGNYAGLLLTSVSVLFGILCTIVGWIGSRVISRQDELLEKFQGMEDRLNIRINNIDVRLVRLETIIDEDLKRSPHTTG